MAQGFRERMAAEVAAWRHQGVVDDDLAARLAARYADAEGAGAMAVRLLGGIAVVLLAASSLAGVGILLQSASPVALAVLVLAAAFAAGWAGIGLARDRRRGLTVTGGVLITFALAAGYAGALLLYFGLGGGGGADIPLLAMLLTAIAALAVAYLNALRWPLFLGLLLLFHWAGTRHGYIGHGGYFLDIQNERDMAVAGLTAVVFGVLHESVGERRWLRRQVGFGHLWLVWGLVYFNLCLWILSIRPGGTGWVLAFSAAGVAQIVAGAVLRDGRFTGFGVVFLAIDVYTRLFERFWDEVSIGGFLLVCGLLGVGIGGMCERFGAGRAS